MAALSRVSVFSMALTMTCILMNVGAGSLVAYLGVPIYLDSIGTVVATVTRGARIGLAVVAGATALEATLSPTSWAYTGTSVVIVLFCRITRNYGFARHFVPTAVFGLLLGVVAALVSAPVTAFVFGGVSLSGTDLITAMLIAAHDSTFRASLVTGLVTDPIDKITTSLLALAICRRLPREWAP